MKRLAAALLLLAPILGGCTAAPVTIVTVTATATATPTTSPPPTPSPTLDPIVEGWKNAKAFTEQVYKNKYDKAAAFVSSGSAADRYLVHMAAIDAASIAAGAGSASPDASLTYSDDDKTITAKADGIDPVVWKSFTFDSAGMVTGWATEDDDTPLDKRLWKKSAEGSTASASVVLVSAYKNDAGLWVVLDVKAKKTAITPDCSPLLDDTDNRQREATNCFAPDRINKGKAGYVAFVFEGADFGGTLRYELESGDYDELGTVKLKIS